jgi:hypothetical protein
MEADRRAQKRQPNAPDPSHGLPRDFRLSSTDPPWPLLQAIGRGKLEIQGGLLNPVVN